MGRGRSKRQRLETEDTPGSPSSASSVSSGSRLIQQAGATGVVNIDEVDLEGRFVRLKNSSDKVSMGLGGRTGTPFLVARVKSLSGLQDQSLGNWRIKKQVLEGEDIAYKFTPKYVLRAGQTVTVGVSLGGSPHHLPGWEVLYGFSMF